MAKHNLIKICLTLVLPISFHCWQNGTNKISGEKPLEILPQFAHQENALFLSQNYASYYFSNLYSILGIMSMELAHILLPRWCCHFTIHIGMTIL